MAYASDLTVLLIYIFTIIVTFKYKGKLFSVHVGNRYDGSPYRIKVRPVHHGSEKHLDTGRALVRKVLWKGNKNI